MSSGLDSLTAALQPPDLSGSGWNLDQQQPSQSTQPSTTGVEPIKMISPTGGGGGQEASVYTPSRPNYLQYAQSASYGLNDLTNFYKSLFADVTKSGTDSTYHSPVTEPETAAPATSSTSATTTGTTAPTSSAESNAVSADGSNKLNGWATTFGLDPAAVVNADGTVDTKYIDKGDPGYGAFGYNTRDPKLIGASLPVDVIKQTIGDYTTNPALWSKIKNGEYKVAVSNGQGVTKVMNIVDAGPANWTGNLVDLTYGATKALGFDGKNQSSIQIIGPDGKTMAIKGFHPSTLTKVVKTAEPEQREGESETGDTKDRTATTDLGKLTPIGYTPPSTVGTETALTNPAREGSFTPWTGQGNRQIRGIVIHSSDGNLKTDLNTLTGGDPNHKVSAHYYTDATGKSYHLVNENDIAYHAGKTTGKLSYLNNDSTIGIEQEHVDGQPWVDAEVKGTAKTVADILMRHPELSINDVVGHSDIAPERKQDPLNFPWDKFRQYVAQYMGGDQGGGESKVASSGTVDLGKLQ